MDFSMISGYSGQQWGKKNETKNLHIHTNPHGLDIISV
jgi:hypothetical protein